ncbi:MAG: aminotransferase class I/II-fold pyridoxal phosphate-dependent enzyme, partial [Chloroflexi bacterium]|nr:aminotransferase class I/II-fold pyridoxal phosphate-dependent enzyme [Chloroflexota bacterium]
AEVGGEVLEVRADAPDFALPVDRLVDAGAAVVLVCDPCNPTGHFAGAGALASLAARTAGATLVVDQSFLPFATRSVEAVSLVASGAILLRSLTKVLAIPGVRAGYAVSTPARIEAMRAARDPWTAGSHAIAAARAGGFALADRDRQRIEEWRDRLADGLGARGLRPLPSAVNFVLAHAGPDAATIARGLAAARIAVRTCGSFGLPEHLRLAVRPPAEQDRFLAALDALRAAAR